MRGAFFKLSDTAVEFRLGSQAAQRVGAQRPSRGSPRKASGLPIGTVVAAAAVLPVCVRRPSVAQVCLALAQPSLLVRTGQRIQARPSEGAPSQVWFQQSSTHSHTSPQAFGEMNQSFGRSDQ